MNQLPLCDDIKPIHSPVVICQAPDEPPRAEPVDLLYKRRFPLFEEPYILARFRSGTAQFLPPERISYCPDLRTIPNG